jgi:hypothetical protein
MIIKIGQEPINGGVFSALFGGVTLQNRVVPFSPVRNPHQPRLSLALDTLQNRVCSILLSTAVSCAAHPVVALFKQTV